MRKVVVFSAALAATCVSAVAVPVTAQAAPDPTTTTPAPTPDDGTAGPSGPPDSSDAPETPDAPDAPETSAPGTGGPDGEPAVPETPSPEESSADGTVTAQAVMVTPEPPQTKTYSYGSDDLQKIDAYWAPAEDGAAPRPAVLIVHGGYWLKGDKGGGWEYFARRLVADGYVVLSTNYRLAPAAQWPAQRTDVLAALNFLKTNADRWNADSGRIVVLGSSSGGHLATQLGTYGDGGERLRGVIALSPPNNPELAYTDGAKTTASLQQKKLRRAVVDLLGCDPSEAVAGSRCWKRLQDTKSGSHVDAADAPMLMMHGGTEFVPVEHSRKLAAELRAAGIEATVKTIEGASHAGALLTHTDTYPTIAEWLKKRMASAPPADGGREVGSGGGGESGEGGKTHRPVELPSALPTQRPTD